ncbi:MAG: hypothetical protein Q8M31_16345 [Beijerinckiaceae bacterium]|nr:hypothetical protein [Beijerinckiaceae bacterium]
MKTLHVFRCGAEDLYAITEDATGANLPADLCSSRWEHTKSLSYEGRLPPWGLEVASQTQQGALLAGLSQNGFFVSESGALPEEFFSPHEPDA